MIAIRNWKKIVPNVAHETAIVWPLMTTKGTEGKTAEEAPVQGFTGLTLHRMQPGKSGDCHVHSDKEQVYYFTAGRGKMNIDDQLYEVKQGDAVFGPIEKPHQLINDSDDWIEHLIINGQGRETAEVTVRNWLDARPYVGHESALIWRIFDEVGKEGLPYEEAPLQGFQSLTMHRMQPGMKGDYHEHQGREQVYYFTEGHGKMKIEGELYDVTEGDAVCVPPEHKHQMINDSDNWLAHLIITGYVR